MDEKKNSAEAERDIIDIYGLDPAEWYGVPEDCEDAIFYEDDYILDLEDEL